MARIRNAFAPEFLEGRMIPSVMTVTSPAEYNTHGTEEPAPAPYGTMPVVFPPNAPAPSYPA